MAEVAGLVLGVVGVAGIIGAFKDAVDLFNLIADSGNLGREFEILDAKLDIEKTLLLQWAEGVGLIRAGLAPRHAEDGEPVNYDTRLADPTTQMMINRALNCIEMLLTNAPELKKRYGLTEAPEGSQTLSTTGIMFSGPRWERFRANYRHWQEVSQLRRDAPSPAVKRIRWVIRDRDKFERLVQEVGHFTSKVREILPVQAARDYVQDDVEATRDFRQLKILQEAASTGSSSAISETAQRLILERCKDRVLARLWFRKIDDRRESITTAHQRTLEWALQPEGKGANWDNLSDWLCSSSGIYWIVGKAGSGKSTLMKYLNTQSRTRTLLVEWAKGERLHLCSYFFYNLGTAEQKSQEGLSRTLLYQILSTHRDIIPEVLPGMWREVYDNESANIEDIGLPSVAETRQAFEVLASNAQQLGWFCFLIDGLDEFVGNYMDGITLIESLASNDRFKIIVSSRPIPDCVAAFSDLPCLDLQELNQTDIEIYVTEVLGGQEYMKRLMARHPEEGQEILHDVIKKSSGVFLWVVLACRSLISGFAAHDRIAELRRRVDELPPELEDMFQLMLSKIEKRHREQGARLLKTCYTFHDAPWDDETRSLYTLGLALVEDYPTDFKPVYNIPTDEKRELCLELRGRLRSRCGGLLEIDSTSAGCLCAFERGSHDPLIDSRVVFMHRSVFEFLRGKGVWDLGVLSLPQDDDYDDATALSLYTLHIAKQLLASRDRTGKLDPSQLFRNGGAWASLADMQPRGDSALFLNNMHSVLISLQPRMSEFVKDILETTNRIAHRGDQSYISFILAIYLGAVNYVKTRLGAYLQADHDLRRCGCPPLLALAMEKRLLSPHFLGLIGTIRDRAQSADIDHVDPRELARTRGIVALLLRSGCDPNEPMLITGRLGPPSLRHGFHAITPWTVFLAWVSSIDNFEMDNPAAPAVKTIILEMLEDFLNFGADLTHLKSNPRAWIRSVSVPGSSSGVPTEKAHSVMKLFTGGMARIDNAAAAIGADSAIVNSPSPYLLPQDQRPGGMKEELKTQAYQPTWEESPGGSTSPSRSPKTPAAATGIETLSSIGGANKVLSSKSSRTRRFRDWIKRHGHTKP